MTKTNRDNIGRLREMSARFNVDMQDVFITYRRKINEGIADAVRNGQWLYQRQIFLHKVLLVIVSEV